MNSSLRTLMVALCALCLASTAWASQEQVGGCLSVNPANGGCASCCRRKFVRLNFSDNGCFDARCWANSPPSPPGNDCKSLKYGGGGPAQRDPSAQISTTPYPAYLEESLAEPWCKAAEASELSGSKSAMVWQADKNDDYWVFHGCDGAGLMADCAGGTQYVEHYIRTATKTAPNKCSWGPIDCSVPDNFDACWCPHSESSFVHPGTSNVYKYEAGQYTWCTDKDGKWPDQEANKPWWDNMGLKDTFDYGCGTNDAITAFVIMYPWVCNDSPGTDLSPLWGDNANFYNGLPYSKKTYQTNCYYDNEPWDILNKQPGYDPHTESSLIPPVWTAYKFVKASEEDQFIRGYKLAWKKSDESTPVTNPNLGKDEGFVLKWKNQNVPY